MPCQSNWYCDGCRKMVYDFRGIEEEQILNLFAQNGKALCGIYDADRITVLPQKAKWIRAISSAVIALSVALLNSCGFGQKDKVYVTTGIPLYPAKHVDSATMGAPIIEKADTPKHHHKQKKVIVRFPPPVVDEDAEIKEPPAPADSNLVFGRINEIQPTYPGGEEALVKYLNDNIKYTGDRQGKAFAQFVVEPDGSLSDIKIVRSAGKDIDEQFVQALKNCKRWNPGIQNGKPHRVQYTVPFVLTCRE